MIEMECDHYKIVAESLSGQRAVDEQSSASLAVLSDRLEQVKKLGGAFSNISFSPEVNELARQKSPAAVC